jgi:hypothetical protein
MLAHRPADGFSGEQIEDYGQVEPALAGRNVGDVRQPELIGRRGHKIPIEQVGGERQRMDAVGRADAVTARHPRPDAMSAHDPRHPLAAGGPAFGTQLGMNARAPYRPW